MFYLWWTPELHSPKSKYCYFRVQWGTSESDMARCRPILQNAVSLELFTDLDDVIWLLQLLASNVWAGIWAKIMDISAKSIFSLPWDLGVVSNPFGIGSFMQSSVGRPLGSKKDELNLQKSSKQTRAQIL